MFSYTVNIVRNNRCHSNIQSFKFNTLLKTPSKLLQIKHRTSFSNLLTVNNIELS